MIHIELHYLPCLAYFTSIYPFETIWLEASEHYQKQSYRNRCYVRTANGISRLTVPILEGTHRQVVRDVRIDYQQTWLDQHWRCLVAAYSKSPFFEHYADRLESVFRRQYVFLFDLNLELLTNCLQILGWEKQICLTETFDKQSDKFDKDSYGWISPRGNDRSDRVYWPFSYLQNFGNDFVPNLSIIDLICCQGPLADEVINHSRRG